MAAVAFALLIPLLQAVKGLALSLVTNALVLVLWLFAYPVSEWLSLRLAPSSWLYRKFFPKRHQWQLGLAKATEALAGPKAGEGQIVRALEIVANRAGVLGAWLLVGHPSSGEHVFELICVAHDESCTGECRARLIPALGKDAGTGLVHLHGGIMRGLKIAISERKVIDVPSESERTGRRSALSRFRVPYRRRVALDMPALDALCQARISLLVPFGGSSVASALVVSGEAESGEFDSRDQMALGAYAKEMSIAMAIGRWSGPPNRAG